MKTLKLALLSFVAGVVLSIAPIVTHACASTVWLQSSTNCNAYDRYTLVSSSSDGGVEVCYYQASGGSQHIEAGLCDDLPYIM
jgi:hypothetical protein